MKSFNFILLGVMAIFAFTSLVQGKNCSCIRGDVCCCPATWKCCNTPGVCCCSSPYGDLYQSNAHQFTPLQTVEEKLAQTKHQGADLHCNTDCFLGQLCGDFCTCIWPNCVEKKVSQVIKNTVSQYQCKPLMADCSSNQECCSNRCGTFNWCS